MTIDDFPTKIVWSVVNHEKPKDVYKYPNGTIFFREKFINIDGYLVRCRVSGNIWFDHKDQGAVYNAIADEEVAGLDNYWVTTWDKRTATTDKELDEYFKTHPYKVDKWFRLKCSLLKIWAKYYFKIDMWWFGKFHKRFWK